MTTKREKVDAENRDEHASSDPVPFFKRYQLKIKASVRAGAAPFGRPPIF